MSDGLSEIAFAAAMGGPLPTAGGEGIEPLPATGTDYRCRECGHLGSYEGDDQPDDCPACGEELFDVSPPPLGAVISSDEDGPIYYEPSVDEFD